MEPNPANPQPLQSFLKRWAVTALGVMAADLICPGIHIPGLTGALIAPLVLGLLNAFLRPLLLLLSLPLLILTLGVFLWVINALLLMLTSSFAGEHFQVDSFWWAMAGAAIISIVSILSNLYLGGGAAFTFNKPPRRPKMKDDDDDNGPVIDV
jgi:putative membrane protein